MNVESTKARLKVLAQRLSEPIATLKQLSAPIEELTLLANQSSSDKGDKNFAKHHYTRIYSALFAPLRDKPIRLLEIGLLHPSSSKWDKNPEKNRGRAHGAGAPSLEMWSSYFPSASIFGFDLNDFSNVKIPRCQITRGDSGSREDLKRLATETGGKFDVIIEDASHASHHQQIALGMLFPFLNPGGIFVIEDLHWQPAELELKDVPKTVDVLRRAEATGVFESSLFTSEERSYLESHVESVELYDSLQRNAIAGRDALGILRKKIGTHKGLGK